MHAPPLHDEIVHASGSLPLPQAVPSGSVVPEHPEPVHMSFVVQSLPSSHEPLPSGVHAEGSPLHVQHCSI